MINPRSSIIYIFLLLITLLLSVTGCTITPNENDITTLPAPRLYTKARLELQNHNYKNAIEILNELKERFPYDNHTESGRLTLAYAYYKDEQNQKAQEEISMFFERHPESKQLAYAYYLRALVTMQIANEDLTKAVNEAPDNRALESSRKAFDYLAQLIGKFPRSQYFDDAVNRLKQVKNSIAGYEVYAARYMFEQGKYPQATRRARYVLKYYPESTSNAEARAILAMGLLESGEKDRAVQVLADLEADYPQDTATKTARAYFKDKK